MNKIIKLQHKTKKNETKEIRIGGFNWLGLFLSYFFYFFRGMWKKGLLLMLVSLVIYEVGGSLFSDPMAGRGLAKIVSIYCAFSINKDYYQHLLKSGWKKHE